VDREHSGIAHAGKKVLGKHLKNSGDEMVWDGMGMVWYELNFPLN